MEENKGVALAILGIVAVVAVFGLVLLFSSAKTGKVAETQMQGYVEIESDRDAICAVCEDFPDSPDCRNLDCPTNYYRTIE